MELFAQAYHEMNQVKELSKLKIVTSTIDSNNVRDLIDTKIQVLDRKIRVILRRWKVKTIKELLDGARKGEIEEAEPDTIELQNLIAKRDEITGLFEKL